MRRFIVSGLLSVLAAASLVEAQRLPSTTPIPSWGPDGTVSALVRSGDRVFLSGGFTYLGPPAGGLASIGVTDASDVRSVPTLPGSVERLESDGQGGWLAILQPFRGASRRLMHLDADGVPRPQWVEPAFATPSPDFGPQVLAVAVAGSRVFVAGAFSTVNGVTRRGLAALDLTTGAVLPWDPRIDERPPFVIDYVDALALVDGVLYAAGGFYAVGGVPRAGLAGFDVGTAALTSFAPAACGVSLSNGSVLKASAGRIYRGCLGSGATVVYDALDVHGVALPTWTSPTGVGQLLLASPTALYVSHDTGRILALDPMTGAAMPWGNPALFATTAVAAAGRLYVTGGLSGIVGRPNGCVVAVDQASGAMLDWAVSCDYARSLATDGQRVAVGTHSVGGVAARGFAAINLRTGRPAPVPALGDDRVGAMHAFGDVVVASVSGPAGPRLRAFSASTATWFGWELPMEGGISAMAATDRTLYVGGWLSRLGGVAVSGLAAVELATGTVRPLNASPIGRVISLGASPGGLYVFGRTASFAQPTIAFDANSGNRRGFSPSPPPGYVAGFAFGPGRVLTVGSLSAPVAAEWYALDGGAPIDVGNAAALDFEGWSVSQSGNVIAVSGRRLNVPRAAILDAATGRAARWDPGAGAAGLAYSTVLATPGYVVLTGQMYAAGGRPAFNLAIFPTLRVTAPIAVAGAVAGFTATVRWQPGAAPVATSYVVEAGTAPGAADIARFSVGAATEVSGTLPPGRYYVRVYGVDDEGESAASDEVVLHVPASIAPPAAPGTLTASVTGAVVSLSWGDAGGATSYVIEAGRTSGATDVASVPLAGTGTSFSAAVPPGTYYVRIRGVNAAGAGSPSNEVVVVVP